MVNLFEICIRTTTLLTAKITTVENCLNPNKNEVLAKKFDTINKFLKGKNVLEGDISFDIRLREQLGSVLPKSLIKMTTVLLMMNFKRLMINMMT